MAVLIALSGSYAPGVGAQSPRWEAHATGTRVTYDTLSALNAPSAGGLMEWRGTDLLGRLTVGITCFEDAGWTLHSAGDVAAWVTPSPDAPVRIELAGSGSGSRHSSGFDSYLVRGDVRTHWIGPRWGGWLGLGAAYTRSATDTAPATTLVPEAGLWGRLGDARMVVGYQTPNVFGQRFHEFTSSLSLSAGAADFSAFAGWRGAPAGSGVDAEAWAGVTGAIWVRPAAAVVVSGGRYGPDVLQGLPGGSFFSIGFRLTNRRVRPTPEGTARAPLLFTSESAERGTIDFRVERATSVEVAGDWNDWEPELLTRNPDDRWALPAGLEPGIYRFNLRVDGVRWIVPDGVPTADDGFGGEVGILIVREGS